VHRKADSARLIGNSAGDCLSNPPRGKVEQLRNAGAVGVLIVVDTDKMRRPDAPADYMQAGPRYG
jgi:hypothetical protein